MKTTLEKIDDIQSQIDALIDALKAELSECEQKPFIDWSHVADRYCLLRKIGKYWYLTENKGVLRADLKMANVFTSFRPGTGRYANMVLERPKDDWIEYDGGPCPVPDNMKVIIKFRNLEETI